MPHQKRAVRGYLLWPWLALALMSSALAADPHDPRVLAGARGSLEGWLTAQGLSDALSIEKLRWGSRPDGPQSQWLRLELRHLGKGTDTQKEMVALLERWKRFGGRARRDLAETLFYKLVQLTGVGRGDAVIEVFVVDQTLVIFRDPGERKLVVRVRDDRQIRRSVQLDGLLANSGQGPGAGVVVRGGEAPRRVQAFLEAYFTEQNRRTGLPPPRFTLKPIEEDFAGIEVEGIKGQVLTGHRYWEKLQIDVDLRTVPGGYRTIWHLSGWSAPGIGDRLPGSYDDSIPDDDLNKFTDKIARALQDALRRPP